MAQKPFEKHYREWLDNALEEFNERYGQLGIRKYHQETVPDNYKPGDLVEFAENGDAYPHGIGGTGHIKQAVMSYRPYQEDIPLKQRKPIRAWWRSES